MHGAHYKYDLDMISCPSLVIPCRRSPGQREIALGAPSPSRGQRSRFLETAARRNYHNADTVQDVDEMAQAQALSHLICGSPEPEGAASSDDHPFGI